MHEGLCDDILQTIPVATDTAAAKQWRAPAFNFYDRRLLGGAWRHEARPDIAREFFRVLAVCHTVIPNGEPYPPPLSPWHLSYSIFSHA